MRARYALSKHTFLDAPASQATGEPKDDLSQKSVTQVGLRLGQSTPAGDHRPGTANRPETLRGGVPRMLGPWCAGCQVALPLSLDATGDRVFPDDVRSQRRRRQFGCRALHRTRLDRACPKPCPSHSPHKAHRAFPHHADGAREPHQRYQHATARQVLCRDFLRRRTFATLLIANYSTWMGTFWGFSLRSAPQHQRLRKVRLSRITGTSPTATSASDGRAASPRRSSRASW